MNEWKIGGRKKKKKERMNEWPEKDRMNEEKKENYWRKK